MSTPASTATRLETGSQPSPASSQPDTAAIAEQLKKMIAHELDVRIPESQIDFTVPLLEGGLALDSMVLFEFLTLIEKRYGIEFADQHLRPEVFENLTVLAGYVQRELVRAGKSASV
ncbi:acyl carrier protein [Archangium violaceum]|uniref:acyl carrier protein n=1 Tax=Archangium violaceum TaxID=83451 RepID=UPI002B2FA53F|nr:acyl carrier protein [Archangium violaceum]